MASWLKFIVILYMIDGCLSIARPVFRAGGDMSDLRLAEDTHVGTNIYNMSAEDPDGDRLYYHIRGDDGFFYVDRFSGHVILGRTLDFDQGLKIIPATILVSDMRFQVKREVMITVLDTNDEEPRLSQSLYQASIHEDAMIGSQVGDDISVTDIDAVNPYINVTCSTESLDPQPSDACARFHIVANPGISNARWTGKLVLNQALNYDEQQSYELYLVVTDGNPENTVRGKVEVTVLKAITTLSTNIPTTTTSLAENETTTVSTEIQSEISTTQIPPTAFAAENTITIVSTDSTMPMVSRDTTMPSLPTETTEIECYSKHCESGRKSSCWEDTICQTESIRHCYWLMLGSGSQEIGCGCPDGSYVNETRVETIKCCTTNLCNDKNFVDTAIDSITTDILTTSTITTSNTTTATTATATGTTDPIDSTATDKGVNSHATNAAITSSATASVTIDPTGDAVTNTTDTTTTSAIVTTDVTHSTKDNHSVTKIDVASQSTSTITTSTTINFTGTTASNIGTNTIKDVNSYATADAFAVSTTASPATTTKDDTDTSTQRRDTSTATTNVNIFTVTVLSSSSQTMWISSVILCMILPISSLSFS